MGKPLMEWTIKRAEANPVLLVVGYWKEQEIFVPIAWCCGELEARFVRDSLEAQTTPEGWELWRERQWREEVQNQDSKE